MTSIDPKLSGAASDYVANVRRRLLETLLQAKASAGPDKAPGTQRTATPAPKLLPDGPQHLAHTRAASAAIEGRLALQLANPAPAGATVLDEAASARVTSRYLAEGESGLGRADIRPPDPPLVTNAAATAPIRPDVISLLSWLSAAAMRPLSGGDSTAANRATGRAQVSLRVPQHDGSRGNVAAVAISIALAATMLLAALIFT